MYYLDVPASTTRQNFTCFYCAPQFLWMRSFYSRGHNSKQVLSSWRYAHKNCLTIFFKYHLTVQYLQLALPWRCAAAVIACRGPRFCEAEPHGAVYNGLAWALSDAARAGAADDADTVAWDKAEEAFRRPSKIAALGTANQRPTTGDRSRVRGPWG